MSAYAVVPRPQKPTSPYAITLPDGDGEFSVPLALPEFGTGGRFMLVQVRQPVGGVVTSFDMYIYDEFIAQLGNVAPSGPPVLESRVLAYEAEAITASATEGFEDAPGDVEGAWYKVPSRQTAYNEDSNLRVVFRRVAGSAATTSPFLLMLVGQVGAFSVLPTGTV